MFFAVSNEAMDVKGRPQNSAAGRKSTRDMRCSTPDPGD